MNERKAPATPTCLWLSEGQGGLIAPLVASTNARTRTHARSANQPERGLYTFPVYLLDMDTVMLLAFVVVMSGFFSGLFAVISACIISLWYGAELMRVKMGNLSPAGVAARIQKAERQDMALGEIAQLMQEEGANYKDVIKKVGLKYPDVALDIAKKMLKKAEQIG